MSEKPYDRLYSIILDEKNKTFSQYDFEYKSQLSGLSLVNIFVGANNSGKSRLLRTFFRDGSVGCTLTERSVNRSQFLEGLKSINNVYQRRFPKNVVEYYFMRRNSVEKLITSIANNDSPGFLFFETQKFMERMVEKKGEVICTDNTSQSSSVDFRVMELLKKTTGDIHRALDQSVKICNESEVLQKLYIPILRGMRDFGDVRHYAERTYNDYFRPENETKGQTGSDARENQFCKDLFTGLELYETLKRLLLGNPEDREMVRDFETYLSKQFYESKQVTLIPKYDSDVVDVKIGNEDQLPIYQLGDGLQQLIILTFKIFTAKERTNFFIEEPDLMMHPGMQRKFLEVLIDHPQHQYFLTTHSNHLLDMTLDYDQISVFLFQKEVGTSSNKTRFRVTKATSRDLNVLQELGVKSSSVFRTNATIWVEGITDRLYLREYLKKYFESKFGEGGALKYQEDMHYSFVEYQGSNLVHWTFDTDDQDEHKIKASFITSHSFLLADGDVSGKGTREEDYREMLGEDNFHILECKEIENLIPQDILISIVANQFQECGLDASEKVKYTKYSQSKQGLGRYLDRFLPNDKKCYATASGTVKNKMKFCKDVIAQMDLVDWELTPELNVLCEKIVNFIASKNGYNRP